MSIERSFNKKLASVVTDKFGRYQVVTPDGSTLIVCETVVTDKVGEFPMATITLPVNLVGSELEAIGLYGSIENATIDGNQLKSALGRTDNSLR